MKAKYSGTSVIERLSSRTIQSSIQNIWVKSASLSDRSSNTRVEPMKIKRVQMIAKANQTQTNIVSVSNKSAVEHNFETNYIRQPKFHCKYLIFFLNSKYLLTIFNWVHLIVAHSAWFLNLVLCVCVFT